MEKGLAYRRAQLERAKARTARALKVHVLAAHGDPKVREWAHDERIVGIRAKTPRVCSCYLCQKNHNTRRSDLIAAIRFSEALS